MKKMMTVLLTAATLLIGGTAAIAAEPQGWHGEIMPYLWYAGLEGDVTVNGHKTDFEKSASDLFDMVEAGGSLLGVVQKDRYVLWGQVDYFSLSTSNLDPSSQPTGGSLDTKMLLGEVGVGYQLDGWMEGQTFDVLVGMRYLRMENDLTVYGSPNLLRSKTTTASDPMLIVRPSIPIFPSKIKGLRFNPVLAIGGGGDSDLVYEMFPQIQYQFTEHLAGRLGYRTIGYKFKGDNGNELNFNQAGLIAGFGFIF